MASDLMMIVDDIKLPGLHRGGDGDYNHTSWYPDNSSFIFDFNGTSIAFIGTYPGSTPGTPTVVTVDNMTFRLYSSLGFTSSTVRQWFQSPMLVDGPHSVSLVNCSTGTSIDFAIVEVGAQTNLTQSTIVVDNVSPLISYSGHWSQDNNLLEWGFPYGNSTHRSSTAGDTFTFWFTGTSVSVYGTLSQGLGVLSATYTLDGRVSTPQTRNITSLAQVTPPSFNSLYYSMNGFSAGNHTLIVNITEAKNHTFVLDFITYTPSFETLSSMPRLNNTTPTTTSSESTKSPTPSHPQTSSTPPTAALVGGVFGVLLALSLFAIVGRWLFLRRRKAKETEENSLYMYEYLELPEIRANNPNPTKGEQQQQIQQIRPQPVKNTRISSLVVIQATNSSVQSLPEPPSNIESHPVAEDVQGHPPPYDTLSNGGFPEGTHH